MSRALLGTLCLVPLLGSFPTGAAAYCRMTTSNSRPTPSDPCPTDGIPLEWRRRCIEYAVDGRGSPDLPLEQVRQIVGNAFATWLAVSCGGASSDFSIREAAEPAMCQEAQYRGSGGNVNTIAFIDDWAEHDYDPLAFALTTVWHNTRTGEIYDADIQMNQTLGPFADCPVPDGCPDGPGGEPEQVDLQNVLTHEIGHFFGLGHTTDTNATMFGMSPRGEVTKRILRTDDVQGFCAVYPPGSLPETCDHTPRGGVNLVCHAGGGGCSAAGVIGHRQARGRGTMEGGTAAFAVLALILTVRVAAGARLRRRRRRRPAP